MVFSSLLIADYLLANQKIPYTPFHILKLTYICHGWALAHLHRPLIDENVEAWKHGPVIPTLYYAFKSFGARPITELSYCNTPLSTKERINEWKEFVKSALPDDSDEVRIIHGVLEAYGKHTPSTLYRITHNVKSPWKKHYVEGKRDVIIPDSTTEKYYTGVLNGTIT